MLSHLPDYISEIHLVLAQRDQYLPVVYGFHVNAASLIQIFFFSWGSAPGYHALLLYIWKKTTAVFYSKSIA